MPLATGAEEPRRHGEHSLPNSRAPQVTEHPPGRVDVCDVILVVRPGNSVVDQDMMTR